MDHCKSTAKSGENKKGLESGHDYPGNEIGIKRTCVQTSGVEFEMGRRMGVLRLGDDSIYGTPVSLGVGRS